ncbi:MAG: helix-turn-helix domain-containing protein [bacterium]
MKKVTQLNHYELLDLEPTASKEEIQQSFAKLRKTYETDSLAVYSILSEEEREYMAERLEEAYKTLIDKEKRIKYDNSIGINTGSPKKDTKIVKFVSSKSEKNQAKTEEIHEDALDPLDQDFLKKLREKKGISLIDISESTNIRTHFLEALENGKYDELPGKAYAVGFLKEFAKYLGIDFEIAKKNMDKWAKW